MVVGMADSGVELIREVLVHGPIARSELSVTLGLSASSLTRIARPYLANGLLIERGEMRDGSMGRPTKPLEIAANAGRVVGVKLTGERAHLVLVDLQANELVRRDEQLVSTDPESVATQVSQLARQMQFADGGSKLLGLCVCLGGNVADDGVVLRAPFLGWRDVPFAEMLQRAAGVPTTLENDVVALAEGEYLIGVARGISNFCLITIGAGVGYGLVMHDRVVKSSDSGLGLGGHIPLDPSGPYCPDGHRGCARAMLSTESLCAQAQIAMGREVTYDELLRLADRDPARAIVESAAIALGHLIALSANLSMHHTVVLSGEGIGLWTVAEPIVRRAARSQRDPEAAPLNIIVDAQTFDVWARGAAAIAIERAVTRLAQSPIDEETRI